MSLARWASNGWLVAHQPSRQEIDDLLGLTQRDLTDARTVGLSADWRFNIAYNAVLQSATAALAATGYRAAREAHHFRILQSLEFTIGAERRTLIQLDQFRKKRNIGGYERVGSVSELEVNEILATATRVHDEVITWLRENHPQLLP